MTGVDIEVIWKVAAVIFGAGAFYQELRAIRKDIARLEEKQDKYNHLQESILFGARIFFLFKFIF